MQKTKNSKNIKGKLMSTDRIEEQEQEARLLKLKVDTTMAGLLFHYQTLKINTPHHHKLLVQSAELAKSIGDLFGYKDKNAENEYMIACYAANIGMIATEGIEYLAQVDKGKMEFYKKHTTRAQDQLNSLGFSHAANIVRNHHEKPNGSGFFREVSYPIESNYIRIADEFSTLLRPNARRMYGAYDLKEAARIVLKPFDGYETIISKEKQNVIREMLENIK